MPEKPDLPEDGSNFDSQQTQPNLPPEVEDSDATRLQSPQDRTRNMPPVKDARLVSPETPRRPPARTPQPNVPSPPPEKPKRGQPPPPYSGDYARAYPPPPRRSNPLSLPIWSVFLMLFMVCGAVSCVVIAILGLGGRNAPALAPQFLVITAAPTETVQITLPALVITATSPLELSAPQAGAPPVVSGPTLAPVVISPTPESIGVGKTVVVDSQESGLNVRSAPGVTTGSSILFVADDGTQLTVVDGPAQADGYTWWKLQDPNDPTKVGWGLLYFWKSCRLQPRQLHD